MLCLDTHLILTSIWRSQSAYSKKFMSPWKKQRKKAVQKPNQTKPTILTLCLIGRKMEEEKNVRKKKREEEK